MPSVILFFQYLKSNEVELYEGMFFLYLQAHINIRLLSSMATVTMAAIVMETVAMNKVAMTTIAMATVTMETVVIATVSIETCAMVTVAVTPRPSPHFIFLPSQLPLSFHLPPPPSSFDSRTRRRRR